MIHCSVVHVNWHTGNMAPPLIIICSLNLHPSVSLPRPPCLSQECSARGPSGSSNNTAPPRRRAQQVSDHRQICTRAQKITSESNRWGPLALATLHNPTHGHVPLPPRHAFRRSCSFCQPPNARPRSAPPVRRSELVITNPPLHAAWPIISADDDSFGWASYLIRLFPVRNQRHASERTRHRVMTHRRAHDGHWQRPIISCVPQDPWMGALGLDPSTCLGQLTSWFQKRRLHATRE